VNQDHIQPHTGNNKAKTTVKFPRGWLLNRNRIY
jgi:hypothetical protein